MKNLSLLIATVMGTLALVVGAAWLFSAQTAAPTGPVDGAKVVGSRYQNNVAFQSGQSEATAAAELQGRPTLVVFSDFQCIACYNLEKSFLLNARTVYGDRINFIYRHFPLDSIHPYARLAAWASEAALDEGKFWEYHDLLFTDYNVWTSLKSKEVVREQLIQYALQLNIDKDRFIARMESDEIKKRVETDVTDGTSLGVNSTPTIYLNNNKTAPQDLANHIQVLLGN